MPGPVYLSACVCRPLVRFVEQIEDFRGAQRASVQTHVVHASVVTAAALLSNFPLNIAVPSGSNRP